LQYLVEAVPQEGVEVVDVARQDTHQLPRLLLVVEGEPEPLDAVVRLGAQVVLHVLGEGVERARPEPVADRRDEVRARDEPHREPELPRQRRRNPRRGDQREREGPRLEEDGVDGDRENQRRQQVDEAGDHARDETGRQRRPVPPPVGREQPPDGGLDVGPLVRERVRLAVVQVVVREQSAEPTAEPACGPVVFGRGHVSPRSCRDLVTA
jgi:hypothetical protein